MVMRIDDLRGWPLLGSLPEVWIDTLGFYARLTRERGPIVRFRLGPFTMHLLNHPEPVRDMLLRDVDEFRKGFGNDVLRPLIGAGLFLAEGDAWRAQRKAVQPLFRGENLARIAAAAAGLTDEMLANWDPPRRAGRPIDVHAELRGLTLRTLSSALIGVDVFEKFPPHRAALERLWQAANARLNAPGLSRLPLPSNLRFRRDLAALDAAIVQAIHDRSASSSAPDHQGEHRGDHLVDLFAGGERAGRSLDLSQLRDEVMTFLLAGHECTSIALAWCIYLLARHPEVEAQLRRELANTPAGETPPSLRPIWQETLRLYPPAWAMARQSNRALSLAGCEFPADAILLVSPWALHRRVEQFPDPERFDPARFTPDANGHPPIHRFGYLPFGAGPRTCIGMGLAWHLAQAILPRILRRFTFRLLRSEVRPDPGLSLRPKNGILTHLQQTT